MKKIKKLLTKEMKKRATIGLCKKSAALVLVAAMCISLTACGGTKKTQDAEGKTELTIAYQYGMAYAPLQVMMEQKLIEKYYPDVTVLLTGRF